ncbi:MAG: FAD-binding protein [Hymenobacter sp.]
MENQADFDVLIIGGSYAGLSAALALGRALRRVLVLDSGQPCNRMTPHSHNLSDPGWPNARRPRGPGPRRSAGLPHRAAAERSCRGRRRHRRRLHPDHGHGPDGAGRKLLFATGVRDILPPSRAWPSAGAFRPFTAPTATVTSTAPSPRASWPMVRPPRNMPACC